MFKEEDKLTITAISQLVKSLDLQKEKALHVEETGTVVNMR